MRFTKEQYAQALFEALAETSPKSHDTVINNFIEALKANGDLSSYEDIIEAYEIYDKTERGVKEVEVTTASAKVNKTLIDDLNKLVGKNAEITQKSDDKIIGGVVIKIDDTLIDGSIKNHLNNLENTLKGSSHG
ncbi:MAG TPA: F0F1 ATP synthase subunit delta [Patescibacteria group bacterium]|jgi:F-type H+-transporting ATPase subunit delta|nr:F0F1 ATP synthase subunit delta [Patescibacteria group bacterium]